jgi:hypothetical protein
MLVRIDGKVDQLVNSVAQKNAWYDVEIALLKARAEKLEAEDKERDAEVIGVKERQDAILTRINVAVGAVGLIMFLSPVLWILVNKMVSGT